MTNKELISIIVPCYNQAPYLNDALQSVSDQAYTHWECIIIDDGSTDNTEKIAGEWCARDSRFRYIKKANGGVSHTRNLGVQEAKGNYILPLDGDDKISPNYVEGCLAEFQKKPQTKVVYGRAEFFGTQKGEWPLPDFEYKNLLTRNLIYCTAMYRKTDWAAIGGYDEMMVHGLEDWDFWLRLIGENDIVTRVNSIVFYYRIKNSSRNADLYNNQLFQQKTYDYLYQKHYEKMRQIVGSPLQLYVEKEDLEKEVERLKQSSTISGIILGGFRRIIKGVLRLLRLLPDTQSSADADSTKVSAQSGSKFNLIKNKIKANTSNNQSFKEIVQSGVFYLSKKGTNKFKKIIRLLVRKVYVFVETDDLVILNGKDHSLIYAKEPYNYWRSKHEVQPKDYETIRKHISLFKSQPFFSVVLFVKTIDESLKQSIRSFNDQIYSARKLLIVTPSEAIQKSTEKLLEEYGLGNSQTVVLLSGELENKIQPITKEHFVIHLKQGDLLTPDAFYWFGYQCIIAEDAGVVYADEDVTDGLGNFYNPQFKPDWSPDNLLSYNYIQRAVIFDINVLQQISGWAKKFETGSAYDIILRASELTHKISHLPKILYHGLEKTESSEQVNHIYNQSKAALMAAMQRREEAGVVVDSETVKGVFIPRYTLKAEAKVSIIIPTKDKIDILKTCIDSIVEKSTYKNYEIVLIDNNSSTPEFFEQVKIWEQQLSGVFNCVRTEQPFNFAFLMNFGAQHCSGDYYVLLNNDTEVITSNWIELLMEQAQRSSVGVVGAKLLYPDNTIQHAGVVMGLSGNVDHVFVGVPRYGQSYQNYIHRVINYSALTAACLMVSKQKFNKVNGFNEAFQVEFNDIDFCLRLKEAGYNHVYLPHVELYHHESISRGHPLANPASYERHLREFDLFQNTWRKYIDKDPCYNPNLSLTDRNMSVAY